jgi:tryptophan synthase alpha chain
MFVAPTSTEERLRQVGELSTGFVYCVALQGVTGARATLPVDIEAFLTRVRRHVKTPVVVGFGLSKPEHMHDLHGKADGAIVASAIVDLISATPPGERIQAVIDYITSMAVATRA